jgi:5-methylcytosine-specific restriction endonuclease McrA
LCDYLRVASETAAIHPLKVIRLALFVIFGWSHLKAQGVPFLEMTPEEQKAKAKAYRQANKEKAKEYQKRYREQNREKLLIYFKEYGQKNKEKVRSKARAYQQKTKQQRSDYQKKYREANKAKLIEQSKANYQAKKQERAEKQKLYNLQNKENVAAAKREYSKKNREKLSEYHRAYRTAKKSELSQKKKDYYQSDQGKAIRLAGHSKRRAIKKAATIGDYQEIKKWTIQWKSKSIVNCHWCNGEFYPKDCHADHVMPLVKGGLHCLSNLVISCAKCNMQKHDKMPEDWIRMLQRQKQA